MNAMDGSLKVVVDEINAKEKSNCTDDNFLHFKGDWSNKDGSEKRKRSFWRGWRKRGKGRGGNVQVKGTAESSLSNITSNGEGESEWLQSKRGRERGFRGRNNYRGNGNRQIFLKNGESCSGANIDNGGRNSYSSNGNGQTNLKDGESCSSDNVDKGGNNSYRDNGNRQAILKNGETRSGANIDNGCKNIYRSRPNGNSQTNLKDRESCSGDNIDKGDNNSYRNNGHRQAILKNGETRSGANIDNGGKNIYSSRPNDKQTNLKEGESCFSDNVNKGGNNSYRDNGNRQAILKDGESSLGDFVDNGGNGYKRIKNGGYTFYRRSRHKKKMQHTEETCTCIMKETKNANSEFGISFSEEPGVKNEHSQRGRFRGSFKQRYRSRENEFVEKENDSKSSIKFKGEKGYSQNPCSSPYRGRGGHKGRGRGGWQKTRQDTTAFQTSDIKTATDNDYNSFSERAPCRGRGGYRGRARGSYRGGEKVNKEKNSAKTNNQSQGFDDFKLPFTASSNNGAEEKHASSAFPSAEKKVMVTSTLASKTSGGNGTVPKSNLTVYNNKSLQTSMKASSPTALQNAPSLPQQKHAQTKTSGDNITVPNSNQTVYNNNSLQTSMKASSPTALQNAPSLPQQKQAQTKTSGDNSTLPQSNLTVYNNKSLQTSIKASSPTALQNVPSLPQQKHTQTKKINHLNSENRSHKKQRFNSVSFCSSANSSKVVQFETVGSGNRSSVTNGDKFSASVTSASVTSSVISAAVAKSLYVPSSKVQDNSSSTSISTRTVTSPNTANMIYTTASMPSKSKNSSLGIVLPAKSKASKSISTSLAFSRQSENLSKNSYIKSEDSTETKLSFEVTNFCKLVVKSYGNVVSGKSDTIVSFLESSLNMRNTPTGQAILLASPTHEEEMKSYRLQPSTPILSIHFPRNLTCKAVCHVVLEPIMRFDFKESLFHRSLNLVFKEVEKIQAKSVSFPPLGCDSPFFFPTTMAVRAFLEFLSDLSIDDSLKKIVVHATSSDLFQEFRRLAPYYFDRAENRKIKTTTSLIIPIEPLQRNTVNFLKYAFKNDEIFPTYWKLRASKTNNDTEACETTWTGIFVKLLVTTVSSWFGVESTPCFKLATLENVDYETNAAITTLVKQTLHPDVIGHGADAFGVRYSSVKVIDIKRIENPTLFKRYHATRRGMIEKMIKKGLVCQNIGKLKGSKGPVVTWDYLPDSLQEELYSEINENYLFHGTNTKAVHSIIENGFDLSYSKDWSLFGKGIYGAEKAMKSDQYADNKYNRCPNGTKLTMILTRMLLGNVFVCDETNKMVSGLGQRRFMHPPCIQCQVDLCSCGAQDMYDSVMGDGRWLFREFVVYNASQCYPEYLITYQRV